MDTSAPGSARTAGLQLSSRTGNGKRQGPTPGTTRAAEMVDFAIRWGPFGGDEYIFPDFGISVATFYRRVLTILLQGAGPRIDPETQSALITLCQRRINTSMTPRTLG